MSTTIGIGLKSTRESGDLFSQISVLADKYEMSIVKAFENAEDDCREGIRVAADIEEWSSVFLIKCPKDNPAALAFEIEQQFVDYTTKGKSVEFFDFLLDLFAITKTTCSKLAIFFAGEWSADEKVRYNFGTIEELIAVLKLPPNWQVMYMNPASKNLQLSDKTPFIFNVKM